MAATTYYFKSIEDLLAESFRYWMTEKDVYLGEYRHSLQKILPVYTAATAGSAERRQQAGAIRDATVTYVVKQAQLLDDRTIELAFKHEALRSEHLRELVVEQDQRFIEDVYALVEAIGSTEPDSDAEITLSLILRLEQQAVMSGIDEEMIQRVVTRHLQHLLEVDII